MKAGIIGAVLVNLLFSKTMQKIFGFDIGFDIFWMWLNFTGFILAVALAYLVSYFTKKKDDEGEVKLEYQVKTSDFFTKEPLILVGFFVVILVFSYMVPTIFS